MSADNNEIEQKIVKIESIYDQVEEAQNVIYIKEKWKSNIWKSYIFHFFMGFHLISGVLLPFFLTWGKSAGVYSNTRNRVYSYGVDILYSN